MELLIYCDDFENAPCTRVEDFDTEDAMVARMDEIDAERKRNRFAYERGYDVIEIVPFRRDRATAGRLPAAAPETVCEDMMDVDASPDEWPAEVVSRYGIYDPHADPARYGKYGVWDALAEALVELLPQDEALLFATDVHRQVERITGVPPTTWLLEASDLDEACQHDSPIKCLVKATRLSVASDLPDMPPSTRETALGESGQSRHGVVVARSLQRTEIGYWLPELLENCSHGDKVTFLLLPGGKGTSIGWLVEKPDDDAHDLPTRCLHEWPADKEDKTKEQ
jgi:hypothetical protein